MNRNGSRNRIMGVPGFQDSQDSRIFMQDKAFAEIVASEPLWHKFWKRKIMAGNPNQ
jgi:hypothetical protein